MRFVYQMNCNTVGNIHYTSKCICTYNNIPLAMPLVFSFPVHFLLLFVTAVVSFLVVPKIVVFPRTTSVRALPSSGWHTQMWVLT